MVLTGANAGERRQRNEKNIERRQRNESIKNSVKRQHSKLFTLVIYVNVCLSMELGFRNINYRDCVLIMIEILISEM